MADQKEPMVNYFIEIRLEKLGLPIKQAVANLKYFGNHEVDLKVNILLI